MGIFSLLEKNAETELINDIESVLRTHYSSGAKELLSRFSKKKESL